ncbi:MAG: class I SAM-dependent methyltransferase [Bacteroidota bacterium]|jgi:O-methyltransferase|nr:class I SAM-dependent methyltransferase [Bacteroidota bacterium]
MKLKTFRFLKTTFIRLKLHIFFSWLNGFLIQLLWMNKISKWANTHQKISFNDFPSKWDYNKRYDLYNYIIEKEGLDTEINYLEFGVANGESFTWWMTKNTNAASRFYGFDTFTGLPEDFGPFKKGTFNTNNDIPKIKDDRGKFLQGLFQQTLPGFLKNFNNAKKTVIMMDADLYTATLFTLTSLAPFLKEGDIILFDEFVVPTHEFMAYQNFIDSSYFNLELIGAANNYYFAAFKVK